MHTGHAVNLWMIRKFQDYGHKVIFLVGDVTTAIGDPTGKSKTRPVISQEDIEENTKHFIEQVKSILRFDDPNLIEIRKNSEWFNKMSVMEFLNIVAMVTHARLVSRDMFQERIKGHLDIYMHEMLYPVLQGYDSFALESDLTIIGTDQLFNEMLGRFYQEKFNQSPQAIVTTKITPGLDGKEKQSKSIGNYIGLAHSAEDKYGRTMTLPDELIIEYFKVYTDIPMDEVKKYEKDLKAGENPRNIKSKLAFEITKRYHGEKEAGRAAQEFENIFKNKEKPTEMPKAKFKKGDKLVDALVDSNTVSSKSEARRLIQQKGVRDNDTVIDDIDYKLEKGKHVVQVGKRRLIQLEEK